MKRALVLTLALVLGLGIAAFAGPLSGSWESNLTLGITTSTPYISSLAFSSTLIVDYTIGGWTFESTTGFTEAGWGTQEFTANGTLGAFTMASDLVFDPGNAAFTSWDTNGSVSIAGVTLNGEFLLADGAGWTFGASGQAGDLSLGATAYFNMDSNGNLVQTGENAYCFCFSSVDFTASFPFACISNVSTTLSFNNSTGFDSVEFSVSGIAIPNIAWLTFDADLTFTVDSKTLDITPNLNLGDFSCITLYGKLVMDGDYTISGLQIYALGLSQTWNGVTFSDLSIFDVSYYVENVDDSWNPNYWELFTIESTGDSCCGGGIDFTVNTYFQNTQNASLFDWGETDVTLGFGIGSNFTLNTGLNVDQTGLSQISFGFKATW